jgi:fatty acid desaturase
MSTVARDIAELNASISTVGGLPEPLRRRRTIRPLADLAIDLMWIVLSVWSVLHVGGWAVPTALLLIGTRQRALGDLLHDASHRALLRNSKLNDALGHSLLAPLCFESLTDYRVEHARHHAFLGDPQQDPDYLSPMAAPHSPWQRVYAAYALDRSIWRTSTFARLVDAGVPLKRRALLAGWWLATLAAMSLLAGFHIACVCAALWLGARASVFHFVTTFRELCDHFGLERGGVFSFTRDAKTSCLLRFIVHPHNNGFHLTHHLLPCVPYHQLRAAQAWLALLPPYRTRATVSDSYTSGERPLVGTWTRATTQWRDIAHDPGHWRRYEVASSRRGGDRLAVRARGGAWGHFVVAHVMAMRCAPRGRLLVAENGNVRADVPYCAPTASKRHRSRAAIGS